MFKKKVLCDTKDRGGLGILDFISFNISFKIKWIIEYLKNKYCIWNIFHGNLFDPVGGIDVLLNCYFSDDKILIKLASFHQQALTAWLLVYKHNFSPQRNLIWNKKDF